MAIITRSSSSAISSTTEPKAIDSCGIHSGVASTPCEISSNSCDCSTMRTA